MLLPEVYADDRFGLSFELFPPKTDAGEKSLARHVQVLVDFEPSYITCTYGAGGSTQTKTLDVITRVKEQHNISVASHLTCVGSTKEQLRDYLQESARRGIDYIVALRGDPPKGETTFTAVDGGLSYANELVHMIREEFPNFGIAVAGYPEVHQEAPDAETDLSNLKRKVAAGGDVVLTQLFYDNADYFAFAKRYVAAGIDVPLVPGILPVTNLGQIQRITKMCGARLPDAFVEKLAEKPDDELWQFQVGVEFATQQVQELIDHGVAGVHFYVLNKSQATSQVLRNLKLPK